MKVVQTRNPLISYLEGKANPRQASQVEYWLRFSKDHARTAKKLAQIVKRPSWEPAGSETDDTYYPHDFQPSQFRSGYFMLAARIMSIFLVIVPMYFLFEGKIKAIIENAAPRYVSMEAGVLAESFELPGGHTVMLKPDGMLTWENLVGSEIIPMALQGAAEFQISPESPTGIHLELGGSTLQAHDAQFTITHDDGLLAFEVVRGEIEFLGADGMTPLRITPTYRVTYAAQERQFSQTPRSP
ncbi:hypothetical protein [Pontibacter sp. G13]|uniref:hypothetical protein n=1 Tax=Pontibacter sp. G13 TaxID=3074898 RepID=UPI00288B33CF|nr:hypothetical protein [Pontibacter sp. G13]WNJ18076.1 hypothetical protein RJD25_24735 [Pontibacter sp. G13]